MVMKMVSYWVLICWLIVTSSAATAKSPITCKDAMSNFDFEIQSGAAYNSMNELINAGTANDNMAQEQRLFYYSLVQQAAALIPSCGQDTSAIQSLATKISEVSSTCGCQARNHTFDMVRVNQAIGKLRSPPSENIKKSNGEYEQCLRDENNQAIEEKIKKIPKNDTVKLLRGSIAGIDFLINVWSKCIPDQRAIDKINSYTKQREVALDTCMKLAAVNTCNKPPF